jgi:hypothetical protein
MTRRVERKQAIMKALQDRWTVLSHDPGREGLKGFAPESWLCVDCGVNTAPGCMTRKETELAFALHGEVGNVFTAESEVYTVTSEVWRATGLEDLGGCLCIGCLEQRIGRRLKPNDFLPDHPLNAPHLPATRRLRQRRGGNEHGG